MKTVKCLVFVLFCAAVTQAFGQESLTPAPSPTTPPFVPSPTPADPVGAFDSVFARFEASTLTPLTGEPFTLTLAVTLPNGMLVVEWPRIEGTWGAFDIRASGDVINADGETRQTFTAVLWRPEDVRTPETYIGYGAGGGDMRRVPVRELVFSVPTVLDPDAETLKPPLLPELVSWPLPLLVILGGVVVVLVLLLWSRRPAADEMLATMTPAKTALSRLRGLTKRPPDSRLAGALAVLRDLHAVQPHEALTAAITTGEALAYTGASVSEADAATFLDLAARAVREATRE